MLAQMTSKNGVRYSTSRAYIRSARERPNLHVVLNTTVSKVLVNPSTKTATGVEIIDQDGYTRKVLAKKEVIVSGGAVNSPQILLLSGIGPRDDLARVSFKRQFRG